MSKTETQSEALTAERRLFITAVANLELRKKFGDEGFRLDLERDELEALIEMAEMVSRLDAENKALRARLEIDPSHPIDGIAARDETIRQLEAQVKTLRPDAERWKAIRLGVPSGDRILRVYTMKQGCGTWLRGTDADFSIDAAMAAAKTGDAA